MKYLLPSFTISPILILVVSLLSSGLGVSAQSGGEYSVHKDLVYSKTDRELTLDLLVPQGSEKPVPCVIVIQGGGFRPQNGQRFKPSAIYLAEHGYAAALISYRGSPDHHYMDTIADTKTGNGLVLRLSQRIGIGKEPLQLITSTKMIQLCFFFIVRTIRRSLGYNLRKCTKR
ncbi:MAG: hypothetical protein O3C43_13445 [Verrucomicrobia bacterium]|nr:hypothetical protein [Verrucomicrobiota bacterium]MDA1067497.1 hypothetical protein [Verrucomicrobiota bacterium]